MSSPHSLVFGSLFALLFWLGPASVAQAGGEVEGAVSAMVKKYKGGALIRDEKRPARPIIGVDLSYCILLDDKAIDEVVSLLRSLKTLEFLNLNGSPITDGQLKKIAELKNLKGLHLDNTRVNDAGLSGLAELKLDFLTLPARAQTDLGLKHYLALTGPVPHLNFQGWKISDAGIKEMAGLTKLVGLTLTETEVAGSGLKHLEGLKGLKNLSLLRTKVDDDGLEGVAELRTLESLDLNYTRITDAGLRHLVKLDRLQSLNLYGTKVTAEGLKQLRILKLQELQVPDGANNDLGLKYYLAATATNPHGFLNLNGWSITDASVDALARVKSLKKVYLSKTKVTYEGAERLRKALPMCQVHK